eukprot:CAMPEP_0174258444 /NCGR_PEP_ID=MMETSP0439-20130205/7433_1 /TAXON_ID=0 /ORGANISM="Stereomyxa ramosa, Strain Chinc5" /LENGTH=75 /DNA_ID=CAMNT_0015341951 /DNA_START=39 /DNA_END=266 /DNA_ORIENTATION=-
MSMTETQRENIRAGFRAMDVDNDGFVTRDECHTTFKNAGFSCEEACSAVDNFFEKCDKNGDGKVSLDEFLQAMGA